MAAPTAQEVRDYYAGLSNLTDAQLNTRIADAEIRVGQDGIGVTNSSYNLLVRLAVGVALQASGLLTQAAGEIVEERVADVMVKYGGGSGAGASGGRTLSLLETYKITLLNVIGLTSRIGRMS